MATYGWAGTILRVDLTKGSIRTEDTAKYKDYIGGMGLGYKIIFDEVPLETKAHDEAAKVVFAVGPLTGSGVPCSGRTNISLLSSWTKGYSILDAHMGGHFAHAMKYAGYDAIVIEGKSDVPVYLRIDDDNVSLESADAYWGKGTYDTNKGLVEENGPDFTSAAIGPAGENLVNYSIIHTSSGNSGGAGVGAALGSKMLKAICVRGTGSVKLADPKEVKELSDYMMRELIGGNNNHNVPAVPQSWAEYSATNSAGSRWQGAPGRRWEKAPGGPVDTGEQPCGDINRVALRTMKGIQDFGVIATKYMVKNGGCSSCPIRCYSEYDMDPLADYELPTKVSNTCVGMFGFGGWYPKGMKDFEDEGDARMIISGAGSYLMDDLGIWENYGNLGRDFSYCYNKGVFKKVLPAEEFDSIPWELMEDGDPRWLKDVLTRLAYKQGEISYLAAGSYQMAQRWELGKEYFDDYDNQNITYNGYPKHHSAEDAWQSGALYNVLYNRDCMIHHLVNFVRSGSPFDIIKRNLEELFGEGCVDAPRNYTPINANKIKLTKWSFLGKQWHDMATLCNWMYPMTLSPSKERGYRGDLDLDARYMTAVTGEKYTREDLEFCSERVSNLLRGMTAISFKLNEDSSNLRKDHDAMTAWSFDLDPDVKVFTEGTNKLDRDDMELAFDMLYEAMGWDKETGIPTRATLKKFGLDDVADKMESLGILPK